VYEHGGTLLMLNAELLAPAAGVLCVDYFFLRRQRINLAHIFEDDHAGRYWYHGGVNFAALISVFVGNAVALWMNNPITHAVHSPVRALGASGPALVLSAALYALFARLWLIPGGHGGYDLSTRPEPLKRPNL
jgi:NCS1 family nucleobase:cation symporter-1